MNDTGIKTKEFPLGKERYCPKCYFGEPPTFEGRVVLRENCEHNSAELASPQAPEERKDKMNEEAYNYIAKQLEDCIEIFSGGDWHTEKNFRVLLLKAKTVAALLQIYEK